MLGCAAKPKAVKLAIAVPLTGEEGGEGQGLKRAAELAVDEANRSGALPFRVQMVAFDDRADPKEAVNVANLAAADPSIVAVIGPLTSGCALPASRVYAAAGVPMLTPTAIHSELTLQQLRPEWTWPRSIFRLPPLDAVQGQAAARFALDGLHWRRVAVVHDKGAYGQALAETFKAAFEAEGGTVEVFDAVAVGDKDFKALLTRLRLLKLEGLFYGGMHTEFGLLMKQSKELGLACGFMAGTGAKSNVLFDVAGPAADGAYLAASGRPLESLPGGEAFAKAYAARYPGVERMTFDHMSYAAVQVVLDALKAAGPDRARLIRALRAARHESVMGPVEFDEKGDNRDQAVSVTRVNYAERRFEFVK